MVGGVFPVLHLEEVYGGGEVCLPSDKIFLFVGVTSILEGRVTLQGHIGALSELRALSLVGVIGALVPEQVSEHDEEKAEQDEGHSGDHSCGKEDIRGQSGAGSLGFQDPQEPCQQDSHAAAMASTPAWQSASHLVLLPPSHLRASIFSSSLPSSCFFPYLPLSAHCWAQP